MTIRISLCYTYIMLCLDCKGSFSAGSSVLVKPFYEMKGDKYNVGSSGIHKNIYNI